MPRFRHLRREVRSAAGSAIPGHDLDAMEVDSQVNGCPSTRTATFVVEGKLVTRQLVGVPRLSGAAAYVVTCSVPARVSFHA
ncbi:MAG: hypothetical protein FJW27_18730 [Acidimicrobiia bacterium]|nr:hypothetical protein [Acidimicrobiia bacterium]